MSASKGSIRRLPSGKLEARWSTTDPNGQRQRRNRTLKATRMREAEAEMRALIQADGQTQAGPTDTLTQAVSIVIEQRIANQTGIRYADDCRTILRRHITPDPIGGIQLADITVQQLEAFLNRLAAKPGRIGKTMSLDRIKAVKKLLSYTYTSYEAYRGERLFNPAQHAQLPKTGEGRDYELDSSDVAIALMRAEQINPKYGLICRLMAMTAARPGEICGLVWSDIVWHRSELRIRRAVRNERGTPIVGPTKTKSSVRTVAVDTNTLADLEQWHRTCSEPPDDHFIFGGPTPMSPTAISSFWHRLRGKAGLPKHMRLYDLRHHAGSLLLQQGVPLPEVSRLMGHANTEITARVYSHALGEPDRHADQIAGAMDNLNARFQPCPYCNGTGQPPAGAPDPVCAPCQGSGGGHITNGRE